ncbi:MAG: c-type cytochrome [Verrucomicrobiaceae bacterium]|nr:c-type cytochrome [Verrucomicrobiaceae bacterium]
MKPAVALALFSLSFSSLTHAAELEGERAAATTLCPSPEEAQKKMTVPDGYEVRCFAHEPMVTNPVAMTWDARGRLWIVEAFEYPEGTPLPELQRPFGGVAKDDQYLPVPAICLPQSEIRNRRSEIPRDRVVILEDTDNDGIADKRTVFVEGLNLASAIICGDDGIYVGQQPHIIHFKDSNHDDKPDEWRVILTGFGREDTHELVNSFTWGPDGWLYMTHGVFTHSAVRRPGQPEKEGFKFDAGIGRARPVRQTLLSASSETQTGVSASPSWEFEVFADGTSNPWGCDYDAAGNFFVSACVIDHFFHMAPGGIYVRQGGAPENPYSYELLPSIVKHRHFRAAYAGVQIYQGGVYPQDTWGHAFIGNIHDNAIHEEVLTPVGSTFKCEPRRDFLRANNGWFRPVSTQTGPDGNLWIMDWCDKYPCYQNAKANPAGVDRDRGRIWRVVHRGASWSAVGSDSATPLSEGKKTSQSSPATSKDHSKASRSDKSGVTATALQDASRPTKDMNLSKLDTSALVKLLGNSNNWMRRMARRRLVESAKHDEIVKAISLVPDNAPLEAKLECLYAMHGIGKANGPLLDKLLKNSAPALRAWSARLTGESWRDPLMSKDAKVAGAQIAEINAIEEPLFQAVTRLRALARDPTQSVRHAVAVALRQWSAGSLTVTKNTILAQDSKWGAPVIDSIYFNLASEEWRVGATPGWVCLFNEADYQPGQLVKREPGDRLVSFAAWQAIQPALNTLGTRGTIMFPISTGSDNAVNAAAQIKACRMISESGDAKRLGKLLEMMTSSFGVSRLGDCLEAILDAQTTKAVRPACELTSILARWSASNDLRVSDAAKRLAVLWNEPQGKEFLASILFDQGLPPAKRIEALALAKKASPELLKDAISRILSDEIDQSPDLALAAIRAFKDLSDATNPVAWTVDHWKALTPVLRLAASESLASRPAWIELFLSALEEKKIPATDVAMTVVRQLTTSKDSKLKERAKTVFGAFRDSPNDIKALITAKKKACLEGEPDLANGKVMFTATCAVCHTFHGGGQKVGPELIGSGRSNLDALLANVIDPNQIIGNGYENFVVTTKDNRTLAGRVTEDTPSHVKLLAIGGAETVVPRDQIVTSVNTHQSLMPMGFGNLPDAAFRDIVWYLLAPPEEGPLTPEKKKLLSTSIDLAAPAKPKGTDWRAIDWESVSHWNPEWKVTAPEFERTPLKLAEYHGKTNVLLIHPFPDKKTPTVIERKQKIEAGKTKLHFSVAADDRGDWKLVVTVNGGSVKELEVDHENPRWRDVEIDLSKWTDQEVTIRLEGHPTDWSWEFGYWQGIEMR